MIRVIGRLKQGKATELIHEVAGNLAKYESTGWEVEEVKDQPIFLSASSLLNFRSPYFS